MGTLETYVAEMKAQQQARSGMPLAQAMRTAVTRLVGVGPALIFVWHSIRACFVQVELVRAASREASAAIDAAGSNMICLGR